MSRDRDLRHFRVTAAAASAGTTTTYFNVGPNAFLVKGFSWMYESTEANADNTLDFTIAYTVDGTNFTTVYANGNANGLLNTAAPLVPVTNYGDAASGGAAAIDLSAKFDPTYYTTNRIPAAAVLRVVTVTAGTGTIPAYQFNVFGSDI